jgi:phenylacetate-coenzyme A ligase PaaK-like adenylate-forming protein
MKEDNRKYWNPLPERSAPEQLLAMELKNFSKLIGYAKDHSAFYREKPKDVYPEDFNRLEAVWKATALLNTPTYGLHLAEEALKMAIDPKKA